MNDPTFYRTPGDAVAAPPEQLAYVAAFDPAGQVKDAMTVIDCDDASDTYGQVVGWTELPTAGNELHHFGGNACSSALCHEGHEGHLERRYLIVPGLRSSRTHILDTKPDPRAPHVVRVDRGRGAGGEGWLLVSAHAPLRSRRHLHVEPGRGQRRRRSWRCGTHRPRHVRRHRSVGARTWRPVLRLRRLVAPQPRHRDHVGVGHTVDDRDGLNPEDLLGRRFGHHLNFRSMSERKLVQRVDLGDEHQMVLELRPAHDPSKTWGFAGVVISVEDLSASVWPRHQDGDGWAVKKVITVRAEPAPAEPLPPALQPFGAVPPVISDIDLSVDDRWLYVSCWGTGELKEFEVSSPHKPKETGSVRLGGIVSRQAHPSQPGQPLNGGPQMVEISRDGKRVDVTNSLYAAVDEIFYPDGVGRGWRSSTPTSPRGDRRSTGASSRMARTSRGCGAPDPSPGRRRLQRFLLLHEPMMGRLLIGSAPAT